MCGKQMIFVYLFDSKRTITMVICFLNSPGIPHDPSLSMKKSLIEVKICSPLG